VEHRTTGVQDVRHRVRATTVHAHEVVVALPVNTRVLLEEERRRTESRLVALTADYDGIVAASRDTNADDEHDPEGATIAFERSQVGALLAQAREHLAEVDAALARLAAGTYGRCGHCDRAIGSGRLQARPAVRLCISCASKDQPRSNA
jgi:DnaK suppressor protein